MPDLQGTASFIGEFLKGYMGQTAQLEDQKYRKVSGILDVADRYRRMAEDPYATDATYNHAQKMYQQQISEADKIMNQKSSTIGSIMKIFGFGKKGANGEPPAIPRHLFSTPTISSTPEAVPEAEPPQQEEGTVGAVAGIQMNPVGQTPLMARRPQFNITGPGGIQVPAPAPGTEQPPTQTPDQNRYAGLGPIARQQQIVKDIEAERNKRVEVESAKDIARFNRQINREDYEWKAGQTEEEARKKVERYKSSPEYQSHSEQERSNIINHILYGTPYRSITPRIKTERVRNQSGQLVTKTIDYSTGEVLSEEPYSAAVDEPLIQAIIAEGKSSGKTITPEEAETELGRRRLQSLNLTNKAKEGNIAAQAENTRIRTEREKFRKEKEQSGGKLSAASALGLFKSAMAHGARMISLNPASAAMSDEEKTKAIEEHAKRYVEGSPGQEGLMKWEDLRKITGAGPAKTAQEEAKAYTGPKPASTPTAPGRILQPPKK